MALTPTERQLLAHYRSAERPPEAARARVLAALARGAPATVSPFDVDPRALGKGAAKGWFAGAGGGALAAKVSIALVSLALPAAWYFTHAAARSPHPRPPPAALTAPLPAAAPPALSSGPWVSPPSASPPAASPSPITVAELPPPTRPGAASSSRSPFARAVRADAASLAAPSSSPAVAPPETPPATTNDPLAEEVRLLRRASEALRAGHPDESLALLAEHESRFPTSALSTTREVTRAIAFCESGQLPRGRALAATLTAKPAAAPFVARLRTACGVR